MYSLRGGVEYRVLSFERARQAGPGCNAVTGAVFIGLKEKNQMNSKMINLERPQVQSLRYHNGNIKLNRPKDDSHILI